MVKMWKNNSGIKEILKFIVGGGSAVITDAFLYALLKNALNISVAKAFSYIAGAAVGFIINKFWTFKSKRFKILEILKYIVLYICSACVNTIINTMVLHIVLNTVVAFLCATGASTVINFLGQKFIVFNKHD